MANYAILKAAIQSVIKQNGNNEITGNLLQQSLLSMINSLGAGYEYAGVAHLTPTPTDPGTPDQNVFYIVSEPGIYSNFGGLVVANGEVAVFKYNGTWSKDSTGAATIENIDPRLHIKKYNFIGDSNQIWKLYLESGVKYVVKFSNDWTTTSLPSSSGYFAINKVLNGVTTNVIVVRNGTALAPSYEFVAEDADYYFINALGDNGENTILFIDKDVVTQEQVNIHPYRFIGGTSQPWNFQLVPGVRYRVCYSNTWTIDSLGSSAAYFVVAKIANGVQTNIVLVRKSQGALAPFYEFVAEDADYYFINALGDSGQKSTIFVYPVDLISEDKLVEIQELAIQSIFNGIDIKWNLIGNSNVIHNISLIAGKTYRITPNPTNWNISSIPSGTAYFVINKVLNGVTTNIVVVRVGSAVASHYDIVAEEADYYYINIRGNSGETVTVNVKMLDSDSDNPLSGLKFACMGDSITSDDVSGIGTKVNTLLETTLVGNFAVGGATCTDWSYNGQDRSDFSVIEMHNALRQENVLKNQVVRLIQWVTTLGEQIKWTHPIDGEISIPTTVGTGLGHTGDIPDVIYIAIGTNDGAIDSRQGDPWDEDGISPTPLVDDFDLVKTQSYSQLTKITFASALRWAIETLQSAFPSARIFVASPLHSGYYPGGGLQESFSDINGLTKTSIIRSVCELCSAIYIPSFESSQYGQLRAKQFGLHPSGVWLSTRIPSFVAKEIKDKYV